jgi:hypothetical protein
MTKQKHPFLLFLILFNRQLRFAVRRFALTNHRFHLGFNQVLFLDKVSFQPGVK